MADTVTLPAVGAVKKTYAVGGVLVLGGILAVAYYRHAKNASLNTAAAAAAAQPDPNAIDPATGLTYAEEAAGIQAGDLAGAGTPYGDTSGIIGYDAQGNPVYADQVGYGPAPSFITNADWAQAAEQYLVQTTGADAGTVAAALGTYLAGQPLTPAQASVVNSARAFFGQPPQAGSNGRPPAYTLVAPPAGGTGGTGGGNPPSGGPPAGLPKTAPAGLSVTGHAGYADVGWGKVTNASGYDVQFTGAQNKTVRTTGNHAEHVTLRPGRYKVRVRGVSSRGDGPWSGTKAATVTAATDG